MVLGGSEAPAEDRVPVLQGACGSPRSGSLYTPSAEGVDVEGSPFIPTYLAIVRSPSPGFVMFPQKSPSPHKSLYWGFSPPQDSSSMLSVDEVRASLCGFKALASRTPRPLLLGVAGQGHGRSFASWLPSPDSLASLWLCSLRQKNLAPACPFVLG